MEGWLFKPNFVSTFPLLVYSYYIVGCIDKTNSNKIKKSLKFKFQNWKGGKFVFENYLEYKLHDFKFNIQDIAKAFNYKRVQKEIKLYWKIHSYK